MTSRIRSDVAGIIANRNIGPVNITSNTTTNGATLAVTTDDRFEAVCSVGTRTDGTYTFKWQDSVDGSTWADVPAARGGAIGAISTANTAIQDYVLISAGRDNLRIVCTSTSVTTGAIVGAHILRVRDMV